ncbi:MAG: GNAT family N-acetyltransferase, partial [Candidatus Bathyarchaeia archaeon]
YPEMSLDHVMAVEHEGETVAALVMIPQTRVLDGLALRVAEMGCVATHPDHRGRGLQRMLNEQFDIFAKRNGFDLCALAGIPYFYRQFGYEYAVDLDHSTSINADTIPYQASSLEIRPFRETDIEAASRMLEDAQSRYHVRCPRTEAVWLMQQRTGYYNGEPFNSVAFIEGCELKAYMRYSLKKGEGSFILKEAVLESPKYVSDVLSFVKEACRKYGLNKVVSMQFYGDEPTLTLIGLGGESVKPYAWQVKILDYLGLLRKLVPLLELRLLRAGYGNLTETLNLNFRKFNIRVKVELGKIVCLEENDETGDRSIGLNPYVFPQMLLGYRSVGELIESYPDVRVSDSYKAIVEALFPKGQGYIFHIY